MRASWSVLLVVLIGGSVASATGQESTSPQQVNVPSRPTFPSIEEIEALKLRAEESESARDQYNFGAALLLAGNWTEAVEPLQRSVERGSDALRDDARYNLGVLDAVTARPDAVGWPTGPATGAGGDATPIELSDDEARDRLLRAREYLRSVLRSDSEAADARWNLELIERWLKQDEPPQGGGGGGGGGQGGGGGGGGGAPDEMTEAEAEAILDAAARTEQDVQSRRMERGRQQDPSAERNW